MGSTKKGLADEAAGRPWLHMRMALSRLMIRRKTLSNNRSVRYHDRCESQEKEEDAQTDRGSKECFFDPAPGGEDAPAVTPCQPTQPSAFALQDNTDDQGN
jgi:hypothetical protein